MILTGIEIHSQVRSGRIQIDPFDERALNPNSYDFHLGETVLWYEDSILDVKIPPTAVSTGIGDEGFVLDPGRIYLGHTVETMGSDHYVPIIRGRSSTARIGLFVHVTADLIDIGSHNQWTLQLHAVQPVRVYRNMRIGQVTFWCVKGQIELYKGKYQGSQGPVASEVYRDFMEPDQ